MPATFQYWRLISTATNGAAVLTIAEIAFLDSNNNAIALTGGTATASTGASPGNAFDGNVNTSWSSTAAPSTGTPQWIQYQFTGAVSVVAMAVTNVNSASWTSQSPQDFLIQASTNGTTWVTQNTLTGYLWYSQSQIVFLSASTVVGDARLSQQAIEVTLTGNQHVRLSQQAVESILNAEPRVKVSQLPFEAILNSEPRVKVSQLTREVIYPNILGPINAIQQFLLP